MIPSLVFGWDGDGTTPISVWLKRDGINPFSVYPGTSEVGSLPNKWGPLVSFVFISFSFLRPLLILSRLRPSSSRVVTAPGSS
jgi:hypothetical protein